MLNLLDEFTRECLAIRVKRRLNSVDAIDVLIDQFLLRGVPSLIRPDNGPEFIAEAVKAWIATVGRRRPTSNLALCRRMAMSKASTPACVMSF